MEKKQEEELEAFMKLQGDGLTGITDMAHTTRVLPWKLKRADLGLFRNLLGRLSCRTLLERRGVQEIWLISRDRLLQTQEWSIPMCRKTSDGGRRSARMNKELLTNIKRKYGGGRSRDR